MNITLQILLAVFLAPIALFGGFAVALAVLGCIFYVAAWMEEWR